MSKSTKIYAQQDVRVTDDRTVRRGEVIAELPADVTLNAFVQLASTGQLSDCEPSKPAEPSKSEPTAKSEPSAKAAPTLAEGIAARK